MYWKNLLPYQREALKHLREVAMRVSPRARETICAVLKKAGIDEHVYEDALECIHTKARIGLHFHPERLSCTGSMVAEGILKGGVYKSQFETGLSSGSPSAFPGGKRDVWERRLFGGAYHVTGALAAGRPKFGALDIMHHPDGPAPRFGSCYFLLHPKTSKRSSFTFGGSHEPQAPERTGTLDTIDPVMAPLLEQLDQGKGAFGVDDLTVTGLLSQFTYGLSQPFRNPQKRPLGRALDSFIEVQIHGDIRLDEDVEQLVADPAFCNHPVGEALASISSRYGIPLCWHPGFTLSVDRVPDFFRGYPVRPLAERIAGQGILDAAKIGAVANTVELEPEAWKDWAPYEDTLTQFRRLWHVLVLYGTPNKALQRTPTSGAAEL